MRPAARITDILRRAFLVMLLFTSFVLVSSILIGRHGPHKHKCAEILSRGDPSDQVHPEFERCDYERRMRK